MNKAKLLGELVKITSAGDYIVRYTYYTLANQNENDILVKLAPESLRNAKVGDRIEVSGKVRSEELSANKKGKSHVRCYVMAERITHLPNAKIDYCTVKLSGKIEEGMQRSHLPFKPCMSFQISNSNGELIFIKAFGGACDHVKKNIVAGDNVYIEGKLQCLKTTATGINLYTVICHYIRKTKGEESDE